MRCNSMKTIAFLAFLIAFALWGIGYTFGDRVIIWGAVALLQVAIASYAFGDINQGILLLIFDFCILYLNTGTFIYNGLTGGKIASWAIAYEVTWEIESKACSVFFLSLICIFLSYIISKNIHFQVGKKFSEIDNNVMVNEDFFARNESLLFASKIVFYIGAIAQLFIVFEKVIFVQTTSYVAYYLFYSSILPIGIHRMGKLMFPALCVYAVGMPRKKQFMKVGTTYLLIGFISIFYGQRNPLALTIIFLIFYVFFREKYFNYGEIWIERKWIVAGVAAFPVFMILMGAYGYWRNGESLDNVVVTVLSDMAESSSGHILLHEIKYHDSLPNQNYVFGPMIRYLTNNYVSDMLGFSVKLSSLVDIALRGNSYGASISYLIMKNSYLNGQGLGSCYLAEVVHDYSWSGVVFISIVYGCILSGATKWIIKFSQSHIFICSGFLMMVQAVVYAPRAEAMAFITDSFWSFSTIMAWLLISLIASQYRKKRYKNGK